MYEKDLFGNNIETKEEINKDVFGEQLFNILNNSTLEKLVSFITNEFDEMLQYIDLRNNKKACQKTSLLFNPHRLNTKTLKNKISIFEAIKDKNFCNGLARAFLFQKENLYNVIQIGINSIQYVNEFPPYLARNLCKKYVMNKNCKVLDPCAGWGGRMIGISTICEDYTCFEPSTRTYNGLFKLLEFIKKLDNNFNAHIYNICFEDTSLMDNYYDFALTSPPYYNTEIYSDEQTNSLNRYNTFDKWIEYFYLSLIQKTMNALKDNSCFVINIGNRKYPLDEILLNNFKTKYEIKNLGNFLATGGGIRNKDKGELFFEIKK